MSFRARRKHSNASLKWLHEHGKGRDPAGLEIYPSKNPETARASNGQTYSPAFNAIAIPRRLVITLKAVGKPFKYQGVVTKSYDTETMLALFAIHRATLFRLVEKELLEAPFITIDTPVGRRKVWFYHQVQPFYVWYMHMKARGYTHLKFGKDSKELALLRRMRHNAEVRFMRMLGVEYVDPYTEKAGKYGVLPDINH